MELKEAREIAIGLSEPSKMPCCGYSIPARYCHTGSKLREVEGTVCFKCYAFKGRYPLIQGALEKRYAALQNPLWVEAMVTLIRETNKGDVNYFRWHDSGDVQDEQHLENICEIARRLPDVRFWLPTKEFKMCRDYFGANAMPDNLCVRLSMPRVDQPAPEKKADDQFTYSEVFSKGNQASNLASICPAKNQGNKCLDCRKCWDKQNYSTGYPAH